MKKLKVAVIGAGAMGKSHIRIYSEIENVELVAICDKDERTAREIAGKYKTKVFMDYNTIDENLDAVSICVPTKFHKEVALFFINKGVNVLIEKPITPDVEEAKELIKAAEKNKVKLMVGHVERFNPVVRKIKNIISKNGLGKIYNISAFRFSPFPHRVIDVGVTIDLAVHDIDVMLYLNESGIKRVYAETSRRIHANNEDLLNALLKFENNVTCSINTNWLTPKKVRKLQVTGEKGMFEADYIKQKLYFYKNEFTEKNFGYSKGITSVLEGKKEEIPINNEEPLRIELEEFVDCIINDKTPAVSGEEGLKVLEIASKILEAAKNNKVINL